MDDRGASDAEHDSDAEGDSSEDEVSESDAKRLWLVERTYTDKGLVSLVYATTDGEQVLRKQRSMNMLRQGVDVTAGITADPESLNRVEDEETREQYAEEAQRMADNNDPDDAV